VRVNLIIVGSEVVLHCCTLRLVR